MSFSVEHLEFYLLILIRISSFVLAAPIFSFQTIPMKIKLALSIVLSIVAIQVVPVVMPVSISCPLPGSLWILRLVYLWQICLIR